MMLLAAALLGTSAANAQSVVITGKPSPSKTVSYDDLNLASEAGKASLTQRIRAAARELCLEDGVQPLDTAIPRRACFKHAVSDGNQQMATAIAARKAGGATAAAVLVIRGQ
jgi:UrcA family protein